MSRDHCHGNQPHCDKHEHSSKSGRYKHSKEPGGKCKSHGARETKEFVSSNSDFDSDYEIYKQKHMQRLQRELSGDRERKSSQERCKDRSSSKERRDYHRKYGDVYEQPVRDEESRSRKGRESVPAKSESEETDMESGVTMSMEDLKLCKKGKKRHKKQSELETIDTDSNSDHGKMGKNKLGDLKDGLREEIDTKKDHHEAKDDIPSEKGQRISKKDQKKGGEGLMPQRSVSPVKRSRDGRQQAGLGSTIGQVKFM